MTREYDLEEDEQEDEIPEDPEWIRLRREFLDTPTPRRIPREIGEAVLSGSRLLYNLVGGFLLIFGCYMAFIFFPVGLIRQWRLDHDPAATVPGAITAVKETNLSISGVPVMENRFRFSPEHQSSRDGTAYTTGTFWKEGAAVQVRYLLDDPATAAPVGARIPKSTAPTLLVLIFPLAGLSLLIGTQVSTARRKSILQNGLFATVTVETIEATNVRVNQQPQFKVTLIRQDNGAKIVKRLQDADPILYLEDKLERREPLEILHDRHKPSRLLLPGTWIR